MRTEVVIRARVGRSPQFDAVGGLAVRQTGPSEVHLVGTAQTPFGGDEIDIRIEVEAGAVLQVRTVAATIALPSLAELESTSRWHLQVGDGARLLVDPEPMIVAGGAHHHTTTHVDAATDSTVVVYEHAQLGRSREKPQDALRARWDAGIHVDIGGIGVLRHRVSLRGDSDDHRVPARALSSVFRYPDTRPDAVSATANAARLRLAAEATLTNAVAESAARARQMCAPRAGGARSPL